jgi:hypothetical protein
MLGVERQRTRLLPTPDCSLTAIPHDRILNLTDAVLGDRDRSVPVGA